MMNLPGPVNFRPLQRLISLGLLSVLAGPAVADFQSLTSIRLQAESFIAGQTYASPYPARFKLGRLDSRLRLRACGEPLRIDFAHRDRDRGNTALTIRCASKSPWKIHLPVQIDLFDDVAVAARPLVKGQLIDAATIRFEKHNIVRLKNGYYLKTTALEELQTQRNLNRGTVLTPRNLAPRLLVRSGQMVTLVLNFNGLQVKSSGQALQSASRGQLVKVRNSQSLRVVEGVVFGEGLVKVNI